MLTLMSLFAFGTVWFWLFVAVHFVFFLWLIECERGGLATVTMILTLAFLQVVGDVKPVTFAVAHPWLTMAYIGCYFVAGTLWSFGKWWFFVRRCREKLDEFKAQFLRRKNISGSVVPEDMKSEWNEFATHHGPYAVYGQRSGRCWKPEASEHKSRILTWMMYWPWSFVWTMIDDPVKRAFRAIYARLQRVYQAISDSAFKGTEEDLNTK